MSEKQKMPIRRIEVTNFKSFKELKVDLGNLNVLIGANASGKSNFIQVFKFLRDIVNFGLENAISMQGGIEYLRNIKIGVSDDLSLKIVVDVDQEVRFSTPTEKDLIVIKIYEMVYEFALRFNKKGHEFKIAKDILTYNCEFVKLKEKKEGIGEEKIRQGKIILSHVEGKIKIKIEPEDAPIKEDDVYPQIFRERLPHNTLLIETPSLFIFPAGELFGDISIYNFDPKLPKKATPITGKAELEEDGSNLSIILKNIMENKEKKRQLFNLVKELLPFVSNLDVEKFADKSLLFKLQERYFESQYLPASLISDGTINITALIVALYFEKKPVTIIEEPERNIHPYLISKVVDIMKDASKKKQIIVTTHNPEIVKYVDLDNLLLVSRDENGFSTVSRPADKKEVNTFLQNEIGIEELYVQNLLEI